MNNKDRDTLLVVVAHALVCPICQGSGSFTVTHPDTDETEHLVCECRVIIRELLKPQGV